MLAGICALTLLGVLSIILGAVFKVTELYVVAGSCATGVAQLLPKLVED